MREGSRLGIPKRRTLFIEKAFQFRLIAKMTALAVVGTALTGGLLYFLADREFGRAFYSAHYQARNSWELLLPAVLASSFVGMCLVAAAAVILTLYDSHRIGGPLYRFRANLKAVGEGDLTLVTRLREKDELQALTDAMNEMTGGLRDKVRAVSNAAGELGAALSDLEGVGPRDADRLHEAEEGLRQALGAFRTEG